MSKLSDETKSHRALTILKSIPQSDIVRISFEESSVHGMAYVVQPKRHILERVFWLVTIALSIYSAFIICHDQWVRYQNNPTVLTLETNYRNWVYAQCGITVCSEYTNDEKAAEIVERLWSLTPNDTKYSYYYDFLMTASTTKYNNFHLLEKYANDPQLNKINMLDIQRDMKSPLQPGAAFYAPVITEMGVCHSTTKLYRYQNINDNPKNVITPAKNPEVCRSIDACKMSIMPDVLDNSELRIYIHNENDIISASDTLHEVLSDSIVIDSTYFVNDMKASKSLLRLSPERRNCLFFEESTSPYFNVYTINLCKITCRLRAAIKYCGCVPFIYNLANARPICDFKGLLCLSKTDWYDIYCECPKLCATEIFIRVHSDKVDFFEFNRMLVLNINFPKNRIKRNVLFSFEDLLVSFGGAAALFLGFSFLSIVEHIYFIFEIIVNRGFKLLKYCSSKYFNKAKN